MSFLIYGSTGFVGNAIARLAVKKGMRPVLGGRNADKIKKQATELDVDYYIFDLKEASLLDSALANVSVLLNCAGPFIHTFQPIVDGCLRTGTHYLDITGEIPVYKAIAARDEQAQTQGVMLLPGVGFDVVPTDCLALYLKQHLPSATGLTLAFYSKGPSGFPPGTQRTTIEMMPYGIQVRHKGQLKQTKKPLKTRMIDFGQGPVLATRLTWGDVFTAYYSTGIPNIEDYLVLPKTMRIGLSFIDYVRPLFKLPAVRNFLKRHVKAGPTAEQRSKTSVHVWGEAEDDQGRKATVRLHGPEAGVEWTSEAALAAVQQVLNGSISPGFQTPALAFGADFVLECKGVKREEIEMYNI